MHILLVDDHQLVAEGISSLLTDQEFVATIGSDVTIDAAYSVDQATEFIDAGKSYELIMLDLSMPSLNGFDFLAFLNAWDIEVPVIVLSGSDHLPDMQKAYDLGAKGYICKYEPAGDMLARISGVVRGEICYPDTFRPGEMELPTASLTERQKEVLQLIADGKSNKQIAEALEVSMATVKFHINDLFKILDVHSRTMCVREAVRLGVIKLSES